jgi:hypothetical protein
MRRSSCFSNRAGFRLICFVQKDPGVRGGPPGAGAPLPGLTRNELALFIEGKFGGGGPVRLSCGELLALGVLVWDCR